MNAVYVLSIELTSTHWSTTTHVDSVYSSEKKAWERIEARYRKLIKTIFEKSIAKVWFAEFRGKSFILSYYTIYNDVVCIKYIIDKCDIC